MKTKAESDKKARKRKIEGLSIFDSEIAAPSDYGDFMGVDAPVTARSAMPVAAPSPAPTWERFMDAEATDTTSTSSPEALLKPNTELGTNQVQGPPSAVALETGYKLGTETAETTAAKNPNKVQTGYNKLETPHLEKPGTKWVQVPPAAEPIKDQVQSGYSQEHGEIYSPALKQDTAQETGYKAGTDLGTNPVQSGNKLGTDPSQTEYSKSPLQKNLGTKLGTEVGTESVQTGYKKGFSSLRGVQRRIVLFLFEASLNSRGKTTEAISIEHLAMSCETNTNTAKVSIKRLKRDGLLMKTEFGNGRGGWTKYGLPDFLYTELLQEAKLGTNQVQTEYKQSTQLGTQLGTSLPSSSSSLDLENLKTTTEQAELPRDWDEIDFSFLSADPIRFGKRDVMTLYKLNLFKAVDVQRSLKEFHFDITQNKKTYGRGALFGVLRKGNLWVASGYEAEEDRIIREQLKVLEARHQNRQVAVEKIEELQFQEWVSGLSVEEKKALSPYSQSEQSPIFMSSLREHYRSRSSQEAVQGDVQSILDHELGPLEPT